MSFLIYDLYREIINFKLNQIKMNSDTFTHTSDCSSLAVLDWGLSPGEIAAIVVTVLLVLVAVGFCCYCRRVGKYYN